MLVHSWPYYICWVHLGSCFFGAPLANLVPTSSTFIDFMGKTCSPPSHPSKVWNQCVDRFCNFASAGTAGLIQCVPIASGCILPNALQFLSEVICVTDSLHTSSKASWFRHFGSKPLLSLADPHHVHGVAYIEHRLTVWVVHWERI